jgi:CO dehydrogenase nickel-insertion accessory protein CooC1
MKASDRSQENWYIPNVDPKLERENGNIRLIQMGTISPKSVSCTLSDLVSRSLPGRTRRNTAQAI